MCPAADPWINKLRCIHTTEQPVSLQDRMQLLAAMWLNPKYVMRREGSPALKATAVGLGLCGMSRTGTSPETEGTVLIARGWRREGRGVIV